MKPELKVRNAVASEPSHPRWRLFRHWLRPARGGAAGVVIVFALLAFIAVKAGLLGIPMGLLLISWFFKYAYILLDHTAQGFDEPPALDIQMLNPVDEQRPLAQLIIIGLIGAALKLVDVYVGISAAVGLGVVAALFLPASVTLLATEGVFQAVNPLSWVRLIRALGWLYASVLLIISGYVVALTWLFRQDWWLPLEIAPTLFAVLSLFSLLGGAVYERRHELDLETAVSPERTEEKAQLEVLRASETLVTEAYGLMRVGAHVKAWGLLNGWLESRGNDAEDYRWLCARVVSWKDPRYITRLTEEHVERLLALKRNGEALDVVVQRLGVDAKFRPKTAAATWSIAQLAARGGGAPKVARALACDFATRFPGDAHVGAAQALARQLG